MNKPINSPLKSRKIIANKSKKKLTRSQLKGRERNSVDLINFPGVSTNINENKYIQEFSNFIQNGHHKTQRIKKTNRYGNYSLHETKTRYKFKKKKRTFFEKNINLKFSTLSSYKSYILKAFRLGYDFDLNKDEGICHLKNYILYKKIRRRGKGG
jgi:hypothetical protein